MGRSIRPATAILRSCMVIEVVRWQQQAVALGHGRGNGGVDGGGVAEAA